MLKKIPRIIHPKKRCLLNFNMAIFGYMIILFGSCTQPDKPPIVIPDPELQSVEINTSDYATHYYSLSQKKIIASKKITDWDLRFCSQGDKYYIYLNTAKNMKFTKYDGKFSDILSPSSFSNWQTDLLKDGKILSSLGSWGDFLFANPKSYGVTYILNLGSVEMVNEFGFRKIQILGFADNAYILKYGKLNDPLGDTIKIEKKSAYNNVYFSFNENGKVVVIEPPLTTWDLNFTQLGISKLVFKDSMVVDTSYSWSDFVLFNDIGRQITCDTIKNFDAITFWDAEKYSYYTSIDYIGSRWRYLDFKLGNYVLSKRKIYIIKDNQNRIYKIEFQSIDKSNPKVTKIGFRIKNL